VFRFFLVDEQARSSDPAGFVTAVPNWAVGETISSAAERSGAPSRPARGSCRRSSTLGSTASSSSSQPDLAEAAATRGDVVVAERPGVLSAGSLCRTRPGKMCPGGGACGARRPLGPCLGGEGKASAGDKTALDTYTVVDRRRLRIRKSTYLDDSRPTLRSRWEMREAVPFSRLNVRRVSESARPLGRSSDVPDRSASSTAPFHGPVAKNPDAATLRKGCSSGGTATAERERRANRDSATGAKFPTWPEDRGLSEREVR
jgi:hypothetical protein